MQNIRTISTGGILQRTSTMFGINNSNWHANAIDWIGDSIQAIGKHVGFQEAFIDIDINNFRANIPNELESLDFITYNGHRLPLGKDNTDYGFVRREHNLSLPLANNADALQLQKEIDRLAVLQDSLTADPQNQTIIDAIINCNDNINLYVRNLRLGQYGNQLSEFYNIDGDYIKTSFATGRIRLTGQSFMLDDNKLPLIIDTFNYKEAVSWFIIYRLLLGGYSHLDLKLMEAKELWEDYTHKASNEGKMPSIDELERFRVRWQTVKREHAEHNHYYIT